MIYTCDGKNGKLNEVLKITKIIADMTDDDTLIPNMTPLSWHVINLTTVVGCLDTNLGSHGNYTDKGKKALWKLLETLQAKTL